MIWIIGAYLSLLIFIMMTIRLLQKHNEIKLSFLETLNQRRYEKHRLVEKKSHAGFVNLIYLNDSITQTLIDKYIITFENRTPYLICNFTKQMKRDGFLEICCYNKDHELIEVLIMKDLGKLIEENYIPLREESLFINFVYHEDITLVPNYAEVLKDRYLDYLSIAKQESFALFFLLVPVGYFILEGMTGANVFNFRNTGTFLIGMMLMFVICLINFNIMKSWIRRSSGVEGVKK
jgi:hypothetical protein